MRKDLEVLDWRASGHILRQAVSPWRRKALTRSDWATLLGVGMLTLANGLATYLTIRKLQAAPSPGLWISAGLLAAFMALSGGIVAYTLMRRRQLELAEASLELIDMVKELEGIYREMRVLVMDAYEAGRKDEHTGYIQTIAVLDETEARVAELEREREAHQGLMPTGPSLDDLSKQVRDLQRMTAEIQRGQAALPGDIDALQTKVDDLAEETSRLQAARLTLDQIDEQILALLTEDPTLTDDEIGRHPKVSLHRTQVTRRRNRLAAAGYSAAKKQQGKRPGAR